MFAGRRYDQVCLEVIGRGRVPGEARRLTEIAGQAEVAIRQRAMGVRAGEPMVQLLMFREEKAVRNDRGGRSLFEELMARPVRRKARRTYGSKLVGTGFDNGGKKLG